MDIKTLAGYLDSTNLHPDARQQDIEVLCQEAVEYQMAAVCVHPCRVAAALQILSGTKVHLATVVGFPLGANLTSTKLFEAEQALKQGADEIDMVINLAALKDRDYHLLEHEVSSLAGLKTDYSLVLKVIVETALLTSQELADMSRLLGKWGADYIKTSTGFASRGVSVQDIETIQKHRSPDLKIKASGGVRTLAFARQLIDLGVDRIGTSQAGAILREMEEHKK